MSYPPEHYREHVLDATFAAWRSVRTGHRVANVDGTPVRQTRELACEHPSLAFLEILHRWQAKRVGKILDRQEKIKSKARNTSK